MSLSFDSIWACTCCIVEARYSIQKEHGEHTMIRDMIKPTRNQKRLLIQAPRSKRRAPSALSIYESDVLTNIDGFLVTDGREFRITIRTGLSSQDKKQVISCLVKRARGNANLGIYMYSLTEDDA